MTATIPAYIARTQLGSLLQQATPRKARFVITKSGKPTAVLLSIADFDDMLEELDPEFRRSLTVAAKEHRAGRSVTLRDYLKKTPRQPPDRLTRISHQLWGWIARNDFAVRMFVRDSEPRRERQSVAPGVSPGDAIPNGDGAPEGAKENTRCDISPTPAGAGEKSRLEPFSHLV